MSSDLKSLILEDAVLIKHGYFTLAVEKAQEKLKKFQLPDPRYYVAQLMQAVLASGAKKVTVRAEAGEMELQFDGPGYTQEELEHLGDAVFESGKNRERDRIRELALCLLSIQALHPRQIHLVSNGFRWEKASPKGRVTPTPEKPALGHRFLVQHTRKDTNEAATLRQVCQSCQADIFVNDTLICSGSRATVTSCPWPNFAFSGPNFRGAFGIAYGEIQATSLVLTRYGVVFSRRHEVRIQPPLVVEMEHEGLRKNASQSDVVEDETYSRMLADLQKVQLEFAMELAKKRIPSYQAGQVHQYLQELALQTLTRELLEIDATQLGQYEQRLLQAPLFTTADRRRCSAQQIWAAYQKYGCVFFTPESHTRLSPEAGTCLTLAQASQTSMKSLFPELRPLSASSNESLQNQLLQLQSARTNQPPAELISRSQGDISIFIPAPQLCAPKSQDVILYLHDGHSFSAHVVGRSPLPFQLSASRMLGHWPEDVWHKTLKNMVEPMYLELANRLGVEELRPQRQRLLQKALLNYLEYQFPCLQEALEGNWKNKPLFFTVQGEWVRLADLKAWLEVYPFVVATFGGSMSQEDRALCLTPETLALLRQILGEDKVRLAEMADPLLVERCQQVGLSQAALHGVKAAKVVDEDAELAALRKEIEQAAGGGLNLSEDAPLDEQAILEQLQLQPLRQSDSPTENQELSEFSRRCLAATKKTGSPRLTRFSLKGLQGQVIFHEGILPPPLATDQLLVKVADNDPVTFNLPHLGVSGWLEVPPGWEAPQPLNLPRVAADSELVSDSDVWPDPSLPLDLGSPALHQDLLWCIRRVYKLQAQHLCREREARTPASLRPFHHYLRWDEGWAFSSPESWFRRVPLVTSLAGAELSLADLSRLGPPLYYVPLGPGSAPYPERTCRLPATLPAEPLSRWSGVQLVAGELRVAQERDELLLAEIKRALVHTCQASECPLEPAWVDGLQFGEPSRWPVGPKKYFIAHSAKDGTTRLNPADRIFQRLFQDPQGWHHQIPVLASSVYTAINRALAEVEDHHELAYLESMLANLQG